jgi:glycosyltransferase
MVDVKVSIITPMLNSESTVEETIKSVLSQDYSNLEYIVVDNGSSDKSLEIANRYSNKISKIIFEDSKGIYTTMNRGLKAATGEIIGILNSDDLYINPGVVRKVVDFMQKYRCDCSWGNLLCVERSDPGKILRYCKSSSFEKKKFTFGWMPPHPTFFVRRIIYEKYGYFNTDLKISADYELMLRLLYCKGISSVYIPEFLVKFRAGGLSRWSLENTIKNNLECYQAWKINGLRPNLVTFILKPLLKFFQHPVFYKSAEYKTDI